ncbi:hypothetical protein LCGC14_1450960 [marine sediment metagenome]|uniref:Uncharacterized protein n=1 Tax=marine sediment metagenome TaxID=412755 RepID=A0A0F9LYJ6_9ZZZZ
MKKYYYVEMLKYTDGEFQGKIQEYYLVKEGWIRCEDYRENVNSCHIFSIEELCVPQGCYPDSEMFETLEEARMSAGCKLVDFYAKECSKLRTAYEDLLKEIKEMK